MVKIPYFILKITFWLKDWLKNYNFTKNIKDFL